MNYQILENATRVAALYLTSTLVHVYLHSTKIQISALCYSQLICSRIFWCEKCLIMMCSRCSVLLLIHAFIATLLPTLADGWSRAQGRHIVTGTSLALPPRIRKVLGSYLDPVTA
jgi:hypothetical protein